MRVKLNIKKAIFSLICSALLVANTCPMQAFAEDADNAVAEKPTFPATSVYSGSTISLSNKTLSSLDNSTVIANDVSSSATNDMGITGELNSFALNTYSSDSAYLNLLKNAALPSQSLLALTKNRLQSVTSQVDDSYWLSDTGTNYGFNVRKLAPIDKDDVLHTYHQNVIGKTNTGYELEGWALDFRDSDIQQSQALSSFNVPSSPKTFQFYYGNLYASRNQSEYTSNYWIMNGTVKYPYNGKVYNNPLLKDDDTQWFTFDGIEMDCKSTNIKSSSNKRYGFYPTMRYNKYTGRLTQLRAGDTINVGDVLATSIRTGNPSADLEDVTIFPVDRYKNTNWVTVFWPAEVGGKLEKVKSDDVYVMGNILSSSGTTPGHSVSAGQHLVRPIYTLDTNNIAYYKNSTSTTTAATSTLGKLPKSSADDGDNVKAVAYSEDQTISANSLNGKVKCVVDGQEQDAQIDGNTIKVPYGTTAVKFASGAFSAVGSNSIDVLARNYKTALFFGKIGSASAQDGVSAASELDLSNLVNGKAVGSAATLSIYGERENAAGVSDTISKTPLSLNIQVVAGGNHNVTYNNGGGSGAEVPSQETHGYGETFAAPTCTGLAKDGNSFVMWKGTWTETDGEHTAYFRPGETITMPNYDLVLTAFFAGINATKDTQTQGIIGYSIDFDLDGGTIEGGDEALLHQKKTKNEAIEDPGSPVIKDASGNTTKVLNYWTFVEGTECRSEDEVAANATPVGKMPKGNVKYKAVYKDFDPAYWLATTDAPCAILKTPDVIQKEVKDIEANGTSSEYYAEWNKILTDEINTNITTKTRLMVPIRTTAETAAGTAIATYSELKALSADDQKTTDKIMECRLIDILVDKKADDSKAALTWQAAFRINSDFYYEESETVSGLNWSESSLRKNMNKLDGYNVNSNLYDCFNTEFTNDIIAVKKSTIDRKSNIQNTNFYTADVLNGITYPVATETTTDKFWVLGAADYMGGYNNSAPRFPMSAREVTSLAVQGYHGCAGYASILSFEGNAYKYWYNVKNIAANQDPSKTDYFALALHDSSSDPNTTELDAQNIVHRRSLRNNQTVGRSDSQYDTYGYYTNYVPEQRIWNRTPPFGTKESGAQTKYSAISVYSYKSADGSRTPIGLLFAGLKYNGGEGVPGATNDVWWEVGTYGRAFNESYGKANDPYGINPAFCM